MKTEKLTIFVVDDSKVALESISRELQRSMHCSIKGFLSAEDCLHSLEKGLPDLILSDYYLDALYERKMNGDQLLARVKVKHPDIPVIMYSSQNSVEVVLRLMKLGAVDFIPKEGNFIRTISEIVSGQIKKTKIDYETKWMVRAFLFTLIVFLASIMLIRTYIPELTGFFFVGVLIFSCTLAFMAGKKSHDHRPSEG